MNWFVAAVLIVVVICLIIGVFRGFLRTVLRLGASVFAAVFANVLGGRIGIFIFPEIIKGDSMLAQGLSEQKLQRINDTVAKTIGIVLLFLILFIIFRIIEGFVVKAVRKNDKISVLDRVLGGAFGVFIAIGVITVLAFVTSTVAAIVTLINPASEIYGIIDNSVIFKHFC